MLILGIDTATTTASAALVEDGKLLREEIHAASGDGAMRHGNHAAVVLPLIDTLLRQSGRTLADVSAFAVALGPGSFTGLRVGLSTVKGLAYGTEAPVVGVPTLAAVAGRVNDRDGFICPFLDARKKEVYGALFLRRAGKLERVSDDAVAAPESVIAAASDRAGGEPCLFIGDAILPYGDLVRAALGTRGVLTAGGEYPSAAASAAFLAEEKIRRREIDPIGPLAPLYLRPSEAELKRK